MQLLAQGRKRTFELEVVNESLLLAQRDARSLPLARAFLGDRGAACPRCIAMFRHVLRVLDMVARRRGLVRLPLGASRGCHYVLKIEYPDARVLSGVDDMI